MKSILASVLFFAAYLVAYPLHAQTPPGKPLDYFPLTSGTSWTYVIEIGEAEPTGLEMPQFPMGQGIMSQITRRRFSPLLEKDPKKTFELSYRIKGLALSQGLYKWLGVEVEVLKDTLKYFGDAKAVFFNILEDNIVNIVMTHDGRRALNAGRGWGEDEDGSSIRTLLFGARPMTQRSFGEKSPDKLLYRGYEKVPGSEDYGLHFVRTVDASEPADTSRQKSVLDEAFTEDTWLVRGKGMVLLIHKRNDKVAMTWKLTDFKKAP